MYLRVHYFTDVIGGFSLGAAWLTVIATGTGAWRRSRLRAAAVGDNARESR